LQRIRPWRGNPKILFDGTFRFTWNRSGYISKQVQLPPCSTGFWIPDQPLSLDRQSDKIYYRYTKNHFNCRLKYVGTDPIQDVIPAETLTRVSLARWWHPDDISDFEDRCYLQLSGWYYAPQTKVAVTVPQDEDLEDDIPF
jgi:hypothetical protein